MVFFIIFNALSLIEKKRSAFAWLDFEENRRRDSGDGMDGVAWNLENGIGCIQQMALSLGEIAVEKDDLDLAAYH